MDMQQLLEAEPFLRYLGIEVFEACMGTVILRLPLRRDVTNHLDFIHGGAQYALGEATAIALAATLFPERVTELDLLTANATITYHRLAQGDLIAWAALSLEESEHIRREFGKLGRIRFPVTVILTDAAPDTDGAASTSLTVECVVRARSV